MPTFAKLVGAVLFGALAWYVTILIVPLFPEGTNLGYFQEVNTFFGLLAGWAVAGRRAGAGYAAAISYGLTALAAMVGMALFFNSFLVMIRKSLLKRYDGPMEAVVDVFGLFVEHGRMILTQDIVIVLVVGGVFAGLVVEYVGRRFG